MTQPDLDPPRLSVLIPTWNAAGTVERAIGSVLEDPDILVECVVVDDGSTDGTPDVVAAVAARDRRVGLIKISPNAGVSNARNQGLSVVRGEWLTFLDADDRLMPGAVAALLRPTSDPSVRAVIGQRIWTDGERSWVSHFYDIPDIREPGRKSIATHPGLLYYASATGKVFHRSLLDGLRFEGRVLGDQPWTIRALLRAGDRIQVIDETVYEWTRPRPDQVVETITSSTRASAGRSAEAAVIARGAFAEVSAEVDISIEDPDARLAVKRAYAERLIRSDFAAALKSAVERHDPESGRLFEAIGSLLGSMPPAVLTPDVLMRALLRPVWDRWSDVSPVAKRSYWHMLDPVRRADPSVEVRLLGSRRRSRHLVPVLHGAVRVTSVSPRAGDLLVRAIRTVASARRGRR
jgi:CDP-ribitol ribitolphosphotransferase